MLGRKLGGRRKKAAPLGSAEVAGGGGRFVSLLGLNGSCRRTPGTLVKGFGCLGGSVEGWRRRLQLGGFLDRNRAKCLL